MEGQPQIQNFQEDEITLKELILKLREYWRELWKHWMIIVLISFPFALYMLVKAWTTPAIYPAALTFMVDEDEGTNISAFSGILGQFGLGGAARGKYNLDKILEISRSRRVIQMALFSKVTIENKHDYLANHIIKAFDLHKKWKKDTSGLNGFLFTHDDAEEFKKTENRALKSVLGILNGSKKNPGIYKTSYDENTGIMRLEIDGPTEAVSIHFIDTLFNRLSTYYVEKSIEKAQATYSIVKSKTDSISLALSSAEYQLANFIDRTRNVLSMREGRLQEERLTNHVTRLQLMYGEALKNLEIAEFSLKNKEPFIAMIDNPLPPIKPLKKSKLIELIKGGILGVFLGIAFVVGRKIYRDTMQETT